MKPTGYKIMALMKRDFKYSVTSKLLWSLVAFSIVIGSLLDIIIPEGSKYDIDMGYRTYMHFTGVLAGIIAVGPLMLSILIAEEKENNTIRTLLCSSATALDFLISKSIVVFIFTEFTGILIFIITGHSFQSICLLSFLVAMVMVPLTFSGIIIGFYSKNQMSANTLSGIIMVLFYLLPFMGTLGENKSLYVIARFSPATAFMELYFSLSNVQYREEPLIHGFLASDLFLWLVMLFWSIFLFILCVIIYKGKKFDKINTYLLTNK